MISNRQREETRIMTEQKAEQKTEDPKIGDKPVGVWADHVHSKVQERLAGK